MPSSGIGIVNSKSEDGQMQGVAVYCHYNGEPDYMLMMLERVYPKMEDAKRIVSLGAISVLGASLDPPPIPEGMDKNTNAFSIEMRSLESFQGTPCEWAPNTKAYHRDRGEAWEKNAPRSVSVGGQGWAEKAEHVFGRYLYVFLSDPGAWMGFDVANGGRPVG